jgi:uncharacterized protein YraI
MRGLAIGVFAVAAGWLATPANAACTDKLTADRELNIRSGPSVSYEPIARIPGDACGVRMGVCRDGWCRVNYRGIRGWASAQYLQRGFEGSRGYRASEGRRGYR